jgi:N-acetylmuramic acid 6-phosphate etherase
MPSPAALPPDRSHVQTEHRHPNSQALDELSTNDLVGLMADDHRAVVDAIEHARGDLVLLIDAVAARMRCGGRLIYMGAGTSGRLGVLDASECPPTFRSDPQQVIGIIAGGDAALRRSSEGKEDDLHGAAEALAELQLTERDTVIGIAAGGTTPYVLGALQLAHKAAAATALITCAPLKNAPAGCDQVVLLNTGPELLTGSTRLKAGSATKLALNIISTSVFIRLGKVYSNLMVDLRATNAKLTDRAIRILCELCPEVSRQHAAELLHNADGELKTAIVMQRFGINAGEARQRLADAGENLRAAMLKDRAPR